MTPDSNTTMPSMLATPDIATVMMPGDASFIESVLFIGTQFI
jgi:hypothetical protein